MQKLLTLIFLVPVFYLSACSNTSPRDDASIAHQDAADISTATPGSDIGKSLKLSNDAVSTEDEQLADRETDAWKRIASGLQITRDISEKTTASKLAWFARNQAYLDRVSERASPYLYYIVEELDKRDMPLDLALLPIVESAYNPICLFPQSRLRDLAVYPWHGQTLWPETKLVV